MRNCHQNLFAKDFGLGLGVVTCMQSLCCELRPRTVASFAHCFGWLKHGTGTFAKCIVHWQETCESLQGTFYQRLPCYWQSWSTVGLQKCTFAVPSGLALACWSATLFSVETSSSDEFLWIWPERTLKNVWADTLTWLFGFVHSYVDMFGDEGVMRIGKATVRLSRFRCISGTIQWRMNWFHACSAPFGLYWGQIKNDLSVGQTAWAPQGALHKISAWGWNGCFVADLWHHYSIY